MNLYLISQTENNDYGTYDSAVVSAPYAETARHMDPMTGDPVEKWDSKYSYWCSSPDKVTVKYLGPYEAGTEKGIILSSYNAG